jgi:hypothetical protein
MWGQLAHPTDNIFLGLPVEASLSKRKRIKRVKELRNLVDANLYGVSRIFVALSVNKGSRFRPKAPTKSQQPSAVPARDFALGQEPGIAEASLVIFKSTQTSHI